MAKNLHPPKELLLVGNLKENFRKFKQQFELYMTATGLVEKEEEIKSSTLLHIIGSEALEIFNTFSWNEEGDTADDNKKVDKILQKFEKYCNPRKNVAYERHVFNKRCQEESESIDTYVTELKILSSSCEFGTLKDSLIRDRIVCGVKNDSVRSRLLRESDLNLEKALHICRAAESSDLQMKGMTGALQDASLNAVRRAQTTDKISKCRKCGNRHEPRNCPAYGEKCHHCGKKNHFAKMCLKEIQNKSKKKRRSRKVNPVDTESSESDSDNDYMGLLYDMVNSVDKDWIVTGEINNREIPMLADTGARCNVISVKTLRKLKIKPELDETKSVLRSFSGHSMKPMGSINLKCMINGKLATIKFQVIRQKVMTIIGSNDCTKIGLVEKMFPAQPKVEENDEIMENCSTGCLPGKHEIHAVESVQPIIHPPKKIPKRSRSAVKKKKLDPVETKDIIVKETEPIDRINSMAKETSSRKFSTEHTEKLLNEEYNIAGIEEYVSMSPELCKKLENATQSDNEMQILREMVKNGWPESRSKVPDEAKLYWNYKDEMSIIENMLFKGDKIIIPKSMRNEMLEYIHESHLGIAKCKARARDCMYWPGMNGAIEDKIAKCSICAKHQSMNPKEPMIQIELPDRPYCKIAVDIFEIKGKQYLVSVDYFSKWPEISKLDNMTSKNVIAYLKSHISKYGIPEEIVSDNAQQFCSAEFKKFAKNYGFKHTTSSPRYAQSNGQVERTVRTVKNLIKKSSDPYLSILDYRNTPIENIGLSPAQMLMGRRLNTKLPIAKSLLKSQNNDEIAEKLKTNQSKSKINYDKSARNDLKSLKEGESVMFRHNNSWEYGQIDKQHKSPKSYIVKSPEGKQYRRNRRHIRPTKSEPDPKFYTEIEIPDENVSPNISSGQTDEQQKEDQQSPQPYVTRSGRTVKPPDKYSHQC